MMGNYPDPTSQPIPVAALHQVDPARLDRQADFHLQMGFRHQAERLAHRAAELREASR